MTRIYDRPLFRVLLGYRCLPLPPFENAYCACCETPMQIDQLRWIESAGEWMCHRCVRDDDDRSTEWEWAPVLGKLMDDRDDRREGSD